jgi:hypothetical protein
MLVVLKWYALVTIGSLIATLGIAIWDRCVWQPKTNVSRTNSVDVLPFLCQVDHPPQLDSTDCAGTVSAKHDHDDVAIDDVSPWSGSIASPASTT